METILDPGEGGCIRTNSPSSIHRQPSASFSLTNKHSMTTHCGNQSNLGPSTSSNACNSNYQLKDLDKYTKYFILKTVQVIVQSRVAGHQKVKTECKPNGNDWFNINIQDIPEVSEITKAALDQDGLSAKSDWRVCCEISLKTSDGVRVALEHWIISNRAISGFDNISKLGFNRYALNQSSSRSLAHDRSSPVHLAGVNASESLTSVGQASTSPGTYNRVRHATFSHTSRSRLNSIDSGSGDECLTPNKPLMNPTNNCDIKPSTSCFSLSSTNNNQVIDQTNNMTASPSISSLNSKPSSSIGQTSNEGTPRPGALSSIYTIYNRMSLLLKTLMTTAHIVPAYRLSSKTSQMDSCVICYRVYTCPPSHNLTKLRHKNSLNSRGSLEEVDINSNADNLNRRSSSNSSLGSLNIKDFVCAEELESFCPIMRLGAIITDYSELDLSLCYRTDISSSGALLKSPRSRDVYKKMFNEDCIMAAKQLLAGNDRSINDMTFPNKHHENDQVCCLEDPLKCLDCPLKPAFAIPIDKSTQDTSLEIIESAFEGLIKRSILPHNNGFLNVRCTSSIQSEPIQVPPRIVPPRIVPTGSTPKSLLDSYVFVDINPPFASEECSDINSFIHGPSPSFSTGFDTLKDVEDVTHQLADIEANATQFDDFVDNMCLSEGEDELRETQVIR